MTGSLVDFYRKHQISPVRQDIRDLQAHFARRASLYQHLGILPAFLRHRQILEIGPGSGCNSLYTASLGPSKYVLLEGNPRGVEDIRILFAGYPKLSESVEIVCSLVDDYQNDELFDFVFCEGVLALAGVPYPERLLRRVAAFTVHGGVLVITCIDAVSDLAETLRRLIAQLVIDPASALPEQVQRLTPLFGPHLSTLAGMSRRHDDWIIDNLLNPASIGPLLTISDAILALDGEYDIFGASPRFLTDWRWYKAIGSDSHWNQLAMYEYWANVHNLLDYRHLSPARDPAENRRLYEACVSVRGSIRQYEHDRDRRVVTKMIPVLDTIVASVRRFSPATADALAEARDLLAHATIDGAAVAASSSFGAWFGRGQQYLSFSRRTA